MRLGRFRKRLDAQVASLAPDGSGGQTVVWTTVGTVWAALVPLNPLSSFSARRDVRLTHKISLRLAPTLAIVAGMRFALGERFFMVRTVTDRGERGQWLDILAEEGGDLT